jgi:hypothetical protein
MGPATRWNEPQAWGDCKGENGSLSKKEGDAAAPDAAAEVQPIDFQGARRVVEVARFMLTNQASPAAEPLAEDAAQETCEPSSETVQKPAGE